MYELWAQHCSEGIQLLESQANHEGPDPHGDYRGVSIVSFQDPRLGGSASAHRYVELFQWTGKGLQGRVSKMDENNRLKIIVAVGAQKVPIDLASTEHRILWRDTGVRAVRAKWKRDQQQNLVPDYLIRLMRMFRLAEASEDASENESVSKRCFICQEVQSNQLPIRNAVCCPLCLLFYHEPCAKQIQTLWSGGIGPDACATSTSPAGSQRTSLRPVSLPEGLCLPASFASRWV